MSGSVRVAHDNGPAIRDALDSLINDDPKGGIAIVPKGRYSIGSLISIPDQVSLEGQGGGVEYGPSVSPDVDAGTAFVWNGPDNMSIFDVRNGVRQAARRFTIDARYVNAGASISTGLTGIHVDADCAPRDGGADKTNLEDLSVIQAHHGIEFGGQSSDAAYRGRRRRERDQNQASSFPAQDRPDGPDQQGVRAQFGQHLPDEIYPQHLHLRELMPGRCQPGSDHGRYDVRWRLRGRRKQPDDDLQRQRRGRTV